MNSMTKKEAIKILQCRGNGYSEKDFNDALEVAYDVLSESQPSSNLNEAAEKMYPMTTTPPTPTEVAAYNNAAQQKLRDAFKAGAEWRDAQIPKLPNSIDEVAENRVTENGRFKITSFEKMRIEDIMFGAEWMAKQGETVEGYITDEIAYNGIAVILDNEEQFKPGDKVIVQIRKKEE